MPRVKRGTTHVKRRRALRKAVKGFMWSRKSTIRQAKTAVLKSGADAYKGRKNKKRDYRALWQIRINNGARELGVSYSKLINALKEANIELDRKVLSDIAMTAPKVFKAIVDKTGITEKKAKVATTEVKEKATA